MHLVLLAAGLISLYLLYVMLTRAPPRAPLPPGPKPLPIIGNLRDMPAPDSPDWLHWLKHKDLYGPISTVAVPGQRLIILNDAKAAHELLEKRSLIYSDRPGSPFASLCGMGDTVLMQGYGKRLRTYRQYIHHEIGTHHAVTRFNQSQDTEVRRFLIRLLETPEHLHEHARGLAGAFILKVLYGYHMDYTSNDPLLDFIEEALKGFIAALIPGTWLVDAVPVLRHLPAWCPGAGFRRTAQQLREELQFLADLPFGFVKDQIDAGSNEASYVSSLLKDKDTLPGSKVEHEIKWTAVSLYFGGADTTVSTIATFFLAMVLYPDVQKRAQEEIDRVVGRGRLPGFSDRANLPYINAVVKEALRWHPVAPMGVAHSSMEDDTYDGYHIPKGSIILPNVWAFCHDPKDYKDPMSFKPERFLGDNPERDPHFVFGYGRRICPGRILAESNLFLTIATSLAAFDIGKPVCNGQEVDVRASFLPGIISHPVPFEMNIKMRDLKYGELIRSVEKEHPWETKDADLVRRKLSGQQ
ncbi:cytochrome P450 [Aspergillus mulundensis]|uniref:Cytochrome P450 n=1 Tax=Aspergillus mulundensis TaxID=1810919 RepID=A0A3D8QS10_9EURO|nr:Uncharacterized protein DSM5745_09978 [Aspergillus mulundensis]RDW64567.1 Uncharacterized protein DSM5745_09978 [Aspergillus mulundensis]